MIFGFGSASTSTPGLTVSPDQIPDPLLDIEAADDRGEVILAGGCFWCVDGVYRLLDGVTAVQSGYCGGAADTANYRAVCSGRTGHAEAVRINYDPARISFGQILRLFFAVSHDPTQLNRQGNDVGTQYRSAIFPLDDFQRRVAEGYISQLDAAGAFAAPIVTTIEPIEAYYPAEDYHQDYAALNPMQPYVACTVLPKIQKLRQYFPNRLRRAAGA